MNPLLIGAPRGCSTAPGLFILLSLSRFSVLLLRYLFFFHLQGFHVAWMLSFYLPPLFVHPLSTWELILYDHEHGHIHSQAFVFDCFQPLGSVEKFKVLPHSHSFGPLLFLLQLPSNSCIWIFLGTQKHLSRRYWWSYALVLDCITHPRHWGWE